MFVFKDKATGEWVTAAEGRKVSHCHITLWNWSRWVINFHSPLQSASDWFSSRFDPSVPFSEWFFSPTRVWLFVLSGFHHCDFSFVYCWWNCQSKIVIVSTNDFYSCFPFILVWKKNCDEINDNFSSTKLTLPVFTHVSSHALQSVLS